jgi:hypothetical protein
VGTEHPGPTTAEARASTTRPAKPMIEVIGSIAAAIICATWPITWQPVSLG